MRVKKIDIGIKGLKESLKDFAEVWKKLEAGKKVKREEGIYFDSIDTMRSVLTNNRLLILKTIRERRPQSVYELAKMLDRDLKNVNQDLKMLSEIGLVTLEKTEADKKRVIPHVDYRKILLEIPV
ncbi:MAG: MarR family transcriptional regulator [Nitrospirae bacterium]|nr:MarR family transcriptional regulator [Nitrospirota bacterium]MCL5978995.1 MarR family transcriptional regulator [Nitrospirota bacterium]